MARGEDPLVAVWAPGLGVGDGLRVAAAAFERCCPGYRSKELSAKGMRSCVPPSAWRPPGAIGSGAPALIARFWMTLRLCGW
jgi:hypothetical protein